MSATYQDLKTIVRDYLQQNFNLNSPFPGAVEGVDRDEVLDRCILRACNNARKWIEKKNNWTKCEVVADITLAPGEYLPLVDLTDKLTDESFRMNTLVEAYQLPEGQTTHCTDPFPLVHFRTLAKLQTARAGYSRPHLVTVNNRITLLPAQTKSYTFTIYGYRWLPDYIDSNEVEQIDWILEDGFDTLQWAALCEVNHLVQHFVARQEGTIPPPESSRDTSLASLIDWDTDQQNAQFNTLQ